MKAFSPLQLILLKIFFILSLTSLGWSDCIKGAVSTYGSGGTVQFGDNAFVIKNPDSTLSTSIVNNSSTTNSCKTQNTQCSASSPMSFTPFLNVPIMTTPLIDQSFSNDSTVDGIYETTQIVKDVQKFKNVKVTKSAVAFTIVFMKVKYDTDTLKMKSLEIWDTNSKLIVNKLSSSYAVEIEDVNLHNIGTTLTLNNASSLKTKGVVQGDGSIVNLPNATTIQAGQWDIGQNATLSISGTDGNYSFKNGINPSNPKLNSTLNVSSANYFYSSYLKIANFDIHADKIYIENDFVINEDGNVSINSNNNSLLTMKVNALVEFKANSTIYLAPGDYYFQNLTIGSNVQIIPTGSGTVRIFVNGTFTDASSGLGTIINEGGNPANFLLYGKNDMVLNGNTKVTGLVISEKNVTLATPTLSTPRVSVTGAIIAGGDIILNASSSVIYDRRANDTISGFNICNSSSSSYITGFFDAWDTFRDKQTAPPTNRNISTKIVNKAFQLSLARLNKYNNAYETKQGTGSVDVAIYPKGSNSPISNSIQFDVTSTNHIARSNDFIVSSANKNAVVGFKLCVTYEQNTTGTTSYYLYPSLSCNSSPQVYDCNASTSGTPTWHICYSSDNFAVRPDRFEVSDLNGKVVKAKDINVTYKALDGTSNPTTGYNEPSSSLDFNTTLADLSRSCQNSNLNIIMNDNFTNGEMNATTSLSNVGIWNIVLREKNGSEFAIVDSDDTNDTQRFITPADINLTIIPDHFDISLKNIIDHGDKFTYVSNDLDKMGIIYDLNVTAKNSNNVVTPNFSASCYAESINFDLNFTIANPQLPTTHSFILYKEINSNQNSSSPLTDGNASLQSLPRTLFTSDKNGTAPLAVRINFNRETNSSLNPFRVKFNGLEVSDTNHSPVVAKNNILSNNDRNATMVYGRANAGKQRYTVPTGNPYTAKIYYQIYCFGNGCNTALLPSVKHSNDIRWYKNTLHVSSKDGNVTSVVEKDGINKVTSKDTAGHDTLDNTVNPATVQFTYDGTLGYPYTTTMEVNASNWLIYNEDDANAKTNSFQVEFNKEGNGWVGKHETDAQTNKTGTVKTNGRTMW